MELYKNQGIEMIKVSANFQGSWPKNDKVTNVSHKLTFFPRHVTWDKGGTFLEHIVQLVSIGGFLTSDTDLRGGRGTQYSADCRGPEYLLIAREKLQTPNYCWNWYLAAGISQGASHYHAFTWEL